MLGTDTEAQDMEWFFFTRKYYKYNKSSRSNRSTKKGYWKITGKERGIKARRSKAVIGNKRTLTFYQARVPKSKKTSRVIHEYYLPGNGVISYLKQAQGDFVICHLMIKSDKKDSSLSNEGEPGSARVSNCENQAADEMDQEAQGREELLFHQPQPLDDRCSSALRSLASQELEAVLQTNSTHDDCSELQSPFGDGDSCLLDGNEVSTCDEYETLYDVFPQLCDPPEENLDSLLRPPQQQDYRPSILQSLISIKLGNVPHPLQP
ncbi:hypothetical protein ABKV19_026482 [Rosa sericea]